MTAYIFTVATYDSLHSPRNFLHSDKLVCKRLCLTLDFSRPVTHVQRLERSLGHNREVPSALPEVPTFMQQQQADAQEAEQAYIEMRQVLQDFESKETVQEFPTRERALYCALRTVLLVRLRAQLSVLQARTYKLRKYLLPSSYQVSRQCEFDNSHFGAMV